MSLREFMRQTTGYHQIKCQEALEPGPCWAGYVVTMRPDFVRREG